MVPIHPKPIAEPSEHERNMAGLLLHVAFSNELERQDFEKKLEKQIKEKHGRRISTLECKSRAAVGILALTCLIAFGLIWRLYQQTQCGDQEWYASHQALCIERMKVSKDTVFHASCAIITMLTMLGASWKILFKE